MGHTKVKSQTPCLLDIFIDAHGVGMCAISLPFTLAKSLNCGFCMKELESTLYILFPEKDTVKEIPKMVEKLSRSGWMFLRETEAENRK